MTRRDRIQIDAALTEMPSNVTKATTMSCVRAAAALAAAWTLVTSTAASLIRTMDSSAGFDASYHC
jgi:hypothetical protein